MNETLHIDTLSNENGNPVLRMTACYTPLLHGSLFSGIGGFDLAAEWAGWQNAFHCEWNDFGQKILKHYWPKAISYGDITKTDFTIHRGTIDVLTGGFPCQPYSLAGKRKGKEDERHLWPEMLRAIREISPTYIVGENVYGLVNWNGGLVFHEVQTDLEAEGYEILPVILPACSVGAPHKRERVWFVAYNPNSRIKSMQQGRENRIYETGTIANSNSAPTRNEIQPGRNLLTSKTTTDTNSIDRGQQLQQPGSYAAGTREKFNRSDSIGYASNTSGERLQRSENNRSFRESRKDGKKQSSGLFQPTWDSFPTQPPICGRNDGLSPKLDGITFPKWRNESIKAYGNAIVPQIALQIFNAINLHVASYGWR